jgi:hypothetical protein
MIGAAAMVAAAGAASAQTTLKAEIPFAFRAGKAMMAPGSYDVSLARNSTGNFYFLLRNADSGQAAMLALFTTEDAPKAWRASETPRLGFECAGERCILRQAWTGEDLTAYRFPSPKLGGEEPMRTAEIPLTVKAGPALKAD